MKLKKIFLKLTSLLMLVSILFIYSCSSDNPVTPVTPTTITVAGRIIDLEGNGIPNTTVEIGSSIKVSGADGTFSIGGVTAPYDVKMVSGNFGLQYAGLSTATPQLLALGPTATTNSATLTVTIPAMAGGQQCWVYFTDGGDIQSAGAPINFPAVSTTLTVTWGTAAASITGKIIVLEDNVIGGVITSYTKYGEKANYTLNNGGTQNQTFTASDINIVPGNALVTGSVNIPAGTYTGTGSELRVKFGNTGSSISGLLLYSLTGNTFSYNVPTGLTTTPTFFVTGFATGPAGGSSFTFKGSTVSVPSTGNVITLEAVPTLSSPPNAATAIDTNTNFNYAQGTGTGINLVEFFGPGKTFYVFTTGTTVKIPNLSALGLGIGATAAYTWDVVKVTNFSGMDQLVSIGLNNNSNFVGETESETRTFTTSP